MYNQLPPQISHAFSDGTAMNISDLNKMDRAEIVRFYITLLSQIKTPAILKGLPYPVAARNSEKPAVFEKVLADVPALGAIHQELNALIVASGKHAWERISLKFNTQGRPQQ